MTSTTSEFGRYAQMDREQRWLVSELPDDAVRGGIITDRYITGTRLRLRTVNSDGDHVFKLAQKIRVDPNNPETLALTNMYITEEEFATFSTLPATEIVKERWHTTWLGRRVSIDVLAGRHAGLLLGECNLDIDEPPLDLPPFATRDVTSDGAYSGGALAVASTADIARLM